VSKERHEEDALLVGRCLEGDRRAWGALLTRHRPLIMAVALRCGLRPDEAEDMYQEVCLTLMERLELLRDHRSLAAWVSTTTARKCWRAKASRTSVASPAGEGAAPPAEPADAAAPLPEEVFLENAEQDAVRQALDALDEPCRGLLHGLFIAERPYAELARSLGLAVGSIGVYRRRCLERLRSRLEAAGWLGAAGGGAP
jgi:RNA polymerase sigma factor (sigma-70 family)